MINIIFRDADGVSTTVQADAGSSLMEIAVRSGLSSIEGECGGALACATCHVYIAPEWQHLTGAASEDERDMLEFGIDVDDRSRLGCQVSITPEMEGMVVLTPVSQR